MSLLDADLRVSVKHPRIRTSTVGQLIGSDHFRWSASERLWRPAGEPWLRRELLLLWTFVIVLSVITYFIVRLLFQLQSNANAQTQSTSRLTEQVAAVAATQNSQKGEITRMQHSYEQVLGSVGDLGHKISGIDTTDRELAADLRSVRARLRLLELRQQVQASSPALPAPATPAQEPVLKPLSSTPAPLTQVAGAAHVHQFLTDITPPNTVEVKQVGGEENVWVIAKFGRTLVVRPFATTSLGIWVHCSTDDRDYILTPSGGWMSASPPRS